MVIGNFGVVQKKVDNFFQRQGYSLFKIKDLRFFTNALAVIYVSVYQ
jgi:hypothetical protein